ncbi:hypothetical protein ACJIZ3_023233 [Penstemon smallii]|uniref:Uncharacterized protein n=1 Tax=Penstemon smallii TaxID=265156 RepID=A0ABD3TQQ8_9LAMI
MKNIIIARWLEKINQAAKYYLVFYKSIPFISVLILVHSWIEYGVIAAIITHLTDDWLHLPKAASIVNVHDGVTAVFVPVVAYASDAYLGPFTAVVCTNVAFIFGLGLLFFSAWRLKTIELQLLYIALLLIALGRAGRDISLKEFLADQFRKEGHSGHSELDEERIQSRRKVWWRSSYILGIGVSVFVLTKASWVKLSNIATIALAVAFTIFIGGIPFFEYKKPTKSGSLNKVVRVLYAAILKRHLSHNNLSSENDHPPILHVPMLSWLDKASIVEPSLSLEEQEKKARLCTVEEVQEVKLLLKMIPLWTTFLVYGLLQATGNTFFFEQVGYMDNSLGKLVHHIPIITFVIIKSATSFIVTRFCDLFLFLTNNEIPRHVMLIRIGIGMAISPLCCVIAWRIEDYRKHQSSKMDISISVFWLVPQFFLLGFMEGLVFAGLEEFFYAQVPKSMKLYGPSFTQFALSIGNFLGLPLILIFRGLFTDDLDTSKLGEYYAILGCVCFVNLVFYCYVAPSYVKGERPPDPEVEELIEQMKAGEELAREERSQIELSGGNM